MKKFIGGLISTFGEAKKNKAPGAFIPMMKSLDNVPINVSDGFLNVCLSITDYLKTAEIEQTNRAQITAKRDVALESIRAQREAFSELMKYTFAERRAVLTKQFEALDHALVNGNAEIIQHSLNAMVAVVQTSPFKTMQEMQAALGSKDFVIRLE